MSISYHCFLILNEPLAALIMEQRQYPISSVLRRFPLPKHPRKSRSTDLDFLDCFGREQYRSQLSGLVWNETLLKQNLMRQI